MTSANKQKLRRSRNQRGLALWAKILIGIAVFGLVVFATIAGLIGYGIYQFKDASAIKQVAQAIAQIQDPLPGNLSYFGGYNVLGKFPFVIILDNTKRDVIILWAQEAKTQTSGADLVNQIAKGGSMPASPTAGYSSGGSKGKLDVAGQGNMDVAGEKMSYVFGKTETNFNTDKGNAEGQPISSFIGAVSPKDKDKIVVIVVQQPSEKEFKMERVESFLKLVKGF